MILSANSAAVLCDLYVEKLLVEAPGQSHFLIRLIGISRFPSLTRFLKVEAVISGGVVSFHEVWNGATPLDPG